MKKWGFILLYFWGMYGLYAQNKKVVDSLHLAYAQASKDTMKVIIDLELAFRYRFNYPDSTLVYAQKALTESKRIAFPKGEGQAWNTLGLGYLRKNQYQLAHDCYEKGLACFEKMRYENGISTTYMNMGVLCERQANFPKAFEHYQKSMEIGERLGNKYGVAKILGNMGVLYEKQEKYQESLQYHLRCYEAFKSIGAQDDIGTALGNIGVIYYYLNDLNKAVEYYQKSLVINEKINNKMGIAYQLNNIGEVYYNQENFPKAIEYLTKSVTAHEEINDRQGLIYPLTCLGISYQKQKDYDKSIAYAQRAFDIAQDIKVWNELKDVAKVLYESYKAKGDYDKALVYHEKYKSVNDSIYNKDRAKAFAKLEAKAEIAEKDKQVALSKIEAEREKNIRLASEKQLEADRFLSLAKAEKGKRKADSLFALSEKAQLEANVFKAQGKTLKAEAQARKAEAIKEKAEATKEKQARAFQQNLTYLAIAGLLGFAVLAYFIFRSRQAETRAKKKIESQAQLLSEANVMKDQLFSVIAHDLRSPMVGFQDLNKQIRYFLRKNQPEKLERLGQEIEKNATVLNSLLNNLLQWAMLQKNMLRPQIQTVKLQEAVEHCMNNFHLLAQTQIVALKHEIAEDVFLETDYNILQTILRNLVSNALKFTPENGTIYLAYQAQGRQGVLSVTDTGVGMSAEKLQMLFGKVQLQNERGVRGEKGIGIGLQLCYELAEKIGASLACQSTEGIGTTFQITFGISTK